MGYSKLFINEQHEIQERLNQIVRGTEQFRAAEAEGKLTRLPTGDGMALIFFTNPEAPVQCALEIARALRGYPQLKLRMGVHSGPVSGITDVNDRSNVAGAGINVAQRLMDCGDAGHILLSKRIAEDLAHYSHWNSCLHDLGEVEVKHGARVSVFNLYTDELGNQAIPEKLRQQRERQSATAVAATSATPRQRKIAIAAVAVMMAIILAVAFFISHHAPQKSTTDGGNAATPVTEKRIAVLPFKAVVPENRDQVLELGMADTLIAKLSNSREIVVSSLNSVRKYVALEQDPVAAGRELQVNSVLEGNVQKSGDHIRVTARLINVSDGSSVWTATFDEKFTDVFAVQDAISQKVADALALQLSGEEKKRLTKRYTDNLEAYQLYLTGRYHHAKLIPPEIREAIRFFQEAIHLDPNYAMAYVGLAEAHRSLAITSDVPSKEALPQAKAAAEKALELDESLAEAHASLSFSLTWFDWDWVNAEKEAKRAIALNPNSSFGHFAYAHVLSDLGRHEEAIAEGAKAVELEPVFLLFNALEGMFLHHAGRNDEAAVRLQKTLELDPGFWVTHLTLGKVYIQQRKYPQAIAEFTKAKELSHGNSEATASIGYVAALSGDESKAHAVLDELKTLSTNIIFRQWLRSSFIMDWETKTKLSPGWKKRVRIAMCA